MADVRSVEIVLKVDNTQQQVTSTSTMAQTTTPVTTSSNNTSFGSSGSSTAMIAATLAAQALKVAVREGLSWAEYYWDRDLTINDDYIGQRNKRIALTQINRVVSYGQTIAQNTAMGAITGGWVGAIIGAAIGTADVIAGISRSNIQGQDQQSIMISQMNAQLSFTRSRIGWSTKAASIGEDL